MQDENHPAISGTGGSCISRPPDPNVFVLSKRGSVYLIYAIKEGPIKIHLERDRDYTVEAIDTWNMTTQELERAKPGEFCTTAPRARYLLRITSAK